MSKTPKAQKPTLVLRRHLVYLKCILRRLLTIASLQINVENYELFNKKKIFWNNQLNF